MASMIGRDRVEGNGYARSVLTIERSRVRSVLITGTSTGIGRATTILLANKGYRVFAGVRRDEDGVALVRDAGPNVTPIPLDVTNPSQIAAAAEIITATAGDTFCGLINNAGIVVAGPVEFVSPADWQRQFDVNFFGQIAVTQAFLPLLRRAVQLHPARIVNISSISGRMTAPILGPYAASKYALEAMSDALRLEIAPQGIVVSLIEPGPIATPIWDKSKQSVINNPATGPAREHYGQLIDAIQRLTEQSERRALPATVVADLVWKCLTIRRPKPRYVVGTDSKFSAVAKRVLPDTWFDAIIQRALRGKAAKKH